MARTAEEPSWDGGRLDERILSTLHSLPGEIAFSGLRRVLRAHPESLARSLRRLEREGLILHADGGYRALGPPDEADPPGARPLRSIAELALPNDIAIDGRIARLAGRWFGTLRWVGVVDRPDGRLLAWAPRSGVGVVLLDARPGRLRILVPEVSPAGDATEAEDAAFELLFHALEALRAEGGRGSSVRAPSAPALAQGTFPAPLDN